jgi:hypothetical protein
VTGPTEKKNVARNRASQSPVNGCIISLDGTSKRAQLRRDLALAYLAVQSVDENAL